MSSSKIHTTSSTQKSVKFMTYNVDQAVREEKVEATKWANRCDRVRKSIVEENCDLIHLQEMRNLDNNISPEEWLCSLDRKYKFIVSYRNPSKYSFGQATVYDSSKLFPVQVLTRWLSDTPNVPSDTWEDQKGQTGFGSNALFVQFAFVENEKIVTNCESFWSVNIHFPLDEDIKTKACQKLLELIDDICDFDRVVLSGDFNFFFDGNRMGAKHLSIMEAALTNISKNKLTSQELRNINGTFVGYPHDEFCAKDPRNPDSCLDYIFVDCDVKYDDNVTVLTKTFLENEPTELSEPYSLPSDHLALVAQLRFDLD